MKKILIFGTGSTGRRIYEEVKDSCEVVAFLDNDERKWGKQIEGIPVAGNSESASSLDYDEVLVCSLPAMAIIKEQLTRAGVPADRINTEYISTQVNARINFIRDFSDIYQERARGLSVAEGGVYQGEFAKEINACFPGSKLYLFDTFEGFDERDLRREQEENYSVMEGGHLGNTSVELVLGKLPHREQAQVRKGFFPETAGGLEAETFFFVNLDFDLYDPTLDGLRFFYPRIAEDGILLIHDYYNPGYKGVSRAVADYEKEKGLLLKKIPIGDHCSIGILK